MIFDRIVWRTIFLVAAMAFAWGQAAIADDRASSASRGPQAAAETGPRPQAARPAAPVRQTVFDVARDAFPGLPQGKVAVRIRAQVNGVAILDDEVRQACYRYLLEVQRLPEPERSTRQKEIINRELQSLIDREVILQDLFSRVSSVRPQYLDKLKEAARKEFKGQLRTIKAQLAKAGVPAHTDEDVRKALAAQGMSLEFFRRQSERQFMAMEYMRSRIFPKIEHACGHEQIVEYYELHPAEFTVADQVTWQDIFIDASRFGSRELARRRAEEVAARARAGEDIAKLIAFDDGDASYRHGEGHGQQRGEIRPAEAEPVLFSLQEGQVGPLIELGNGFHVVRLVKRQYAGRRPLDEAAQAEIRKKLQNALAEREYKRLLAELKRKATIEIASD